MGSHGFTYRTTLVGAAVAALLVGATSVGAQAGPTGAAPAGNAAAGGNASYWTPARRAAAQPRDLVIDQRGLGYLKQANGTLEPHGHSIAATVAVPVRASAPSGSLRPQAGPPSGSGGSPTVVDGVDPGNGATVGASHRFQAAVTDLDGIRSVDFVLSQGAASGTFAANLIGQDLYVIDFEFIVGSADGPWTWKIVTRDNGKRGGTTTTTESYSFTVDTGGTTPPPTDPPPTDPSTTLPPGSCDNSGATVVNDPWTCDGALQTAAGRIYFEMPAKGKNRWAGYVCSGTAVDDETADTSIVLTAGHCVYDDVNKAFARNVLFIPDQDETTGAGTDIDCSNDPLGCWEPSHGVVDRDWTLRTFPANIPYDYAYYVVPDGAHKGNGVGGSLASVAGTLPIQFEGPTLGARTHALGYSYSDDPNFMYCAESLAIEGSYSDYWLASCGLSGGASGGPWIQPMVETTGTGPIISLNSWGYTNSPGMAGPLLTTSAKCVFDAAQDATLTPANRGIIVTC